MGLTQTFSDLKRAPLSWRYMWSHFFSPAHIIKSNLGEAVTFSRKFLLWSLLFSLNAVLPDGGICLREGKGTVFLMMVFGDGIILSSLVTWDLALMEYARLWRSSETHDWPKEGKRSSALLAERSIGCDRSARWTCLKLQDSALWSISVMCFSWFDTPLFWLPCWLI